MQAIACLAHNKDMEYYCREYQHNDLESLKTLMLELGYSVELPELRETITEIYNQRGIIFVSEQGNQVIGSVCVILDARLAEGVCAEIVSLIVSENFRGQGVGKTLIHVAEEWAKKRVRKIRVRANTIRRAAHSFYESKGFESIKTQKIFLKNL